MPADRRTGRTRVASATATATAAAAASLLVASGDAALAFSPPARPASRPALAFGAAPASSSPALRPSRGRWGGGRPLFSSEEPPSDEIAAAASDGPEEMNRADIDPLEYFASLPGGGNDFTADDDDANAWVSAADVDGGEDGRDWEDVVKSRTDGTVWSSFESAADDGEGATEDNVKKEHESEDDGEAAWLDTLASIAAEEVEFNLKEADRADKVRQMQEWGFTSESISSTLGVATDESLEAFENNEVFEQFKEVTAETGFGMYVGDDIDPSEVESHVTVERDDESGDLVRTQMVYVDEHTCIGCTNCAMIAQSTFFMDEEYGRARVFQQWGDDDETIQVAIETCPVDCIHYVPYDELVRLEVERRDQNINFKARLVNQGETDQRGYGGASAFTGPQKISGNMAARCNNCPSRGCKNCPMYGIGENPEFKKREQARKERRAKMLLKEKMESENKSVDL